jgi:hypothetical protein
MTKDHEGIVTSSPGDQDSTPRYKLSELLQHSEVSRQLSPEDKEWLNAPSVGREQVDD